MNHMNSKIIEKKLFMMSEITKNITPAYWPHDVFLEDNNYRWVKPEYFYENYKCLMKAIEIYMESYEDSNLIKIENKFFNFMLWLNNNPIVSEQYIPDKISLNEYEKDVFHVIETISQILYTQLAPQFYNQIKNSLQKKNFYDKNCFSEYLESVNEVLEQTMSYLPSESQEQVDIFSNQIYYIIKNQG